MSENIKKKLKQVSLGSESKDGVRVRNSELLRMLTEAKAEYLKKGGMTLEKYIAERKRK
ncbi:MAG: hypothetical protein M0Z70_02440 [Nitrospiraceae bacterium]|nr:hypothetical protein [Nitrospiraceae bacterium]